MKYLPLLLAKKPACYALPCHVNLDEISPIAQQQTYKHCDYSNRFHATCSLSDLKVSASSCVFSVTLTDRCEFLWADRHCDETQSGPVYWCSHNLNTLRGLMSILTRLSLWPHFLLLGDSDGAVRMLMHLGNVAHMCVLFACGKKKKKTKSKEGCVCVS